MSLLWFWQRKERLALVILGILLVSAAAGMAAATARSTQGTVDEELARHWRTDYDLLVRHPSSVNDLENEEGIVSGKYQSNVSGKSSITPAQLEAIRNISGVEVAAPLTIIGPASFTWDMAVPLDYGNLLPGIYREHIEYVLHNGFEEVKTLFSRNFIVGEGFNFSNPKEIPVPNYPHNWESFLRSAGLNAAQPRVYLQPYYLSVVAVDFDAEAKLHGLDKAVIAGKFNLPPASREADEVYRIPVLLNQSALPRGTVEVKLHRLEGATATKTTLTDAYYADYDYFSGFNQSLVVEQSINLEEDFALPELGRQIAYSKEKAGTGFSYQREDSFLATTAVGRGSNFTASPIFAYFSGLDITSDNSIPLFRGVDGHGDLNANLHFTFGGLFNPDKLTIQPSVSPVAAPTEIYNAAPDRILQNGQDILDTPAFINSIHPFDFAGAPIGMLISIENLAIATGANTIDSIRVRVDGVDDMSQQSQLRIAAIAQQIRDETGLHVDIVLGSSRQRQEVKLYDYHSPGRTAYIEKVQSAMAEIIPHLEKQTDLPVTWELITFEDDYWHAKRPTRLFLSLPNPSKFPVDADSLRQVMVPYLEEKLAFLSLPYVQVHSDSNKSIKIYVPDYQIPDDEPRTLLGVIEQFWIQLGTQIRIYKETNRGTFWITLGLLTVSALFIGNSTYISGIGRTREFSVLRSLGWRRSTVFRFSLTENIAIATVAGVVTAGVMMIIWQFSQQHLETWLLTAVAPAVFLTFIIGGLPPLAKTLYIQPLEGVRRGEIRNQTRIGGAGRLGFVLRGLVSRPGRTCVTVFALLVPAGILAFNYFIYFGIQQLLGETLMGEYLAVELKGYHFILNALVFAVAGLAVTDTLLINLRERQKEFCLLKALGWRNSSVASLLLLEGISLGLVSGLVGVSLAAGIYWHVFKMVPPNLQVSFILLALFPGLVGALASLAPVIRAAALPPAQILKEE